MFAGASFGAAVPESALPAGAKHALKFARAPVGAA
jgi:hypothetical protein